MVVRDEDEKNGGDKVASKATTTVLTTCINGDL